MTRLETNYGRLAGLAIPPTLKEAIFAASSAPTIRKRRLKSPASLMVLAEIESVQASVKSGRTLRALFDR